MAIYEYGTLNTAALVVPDLYVQVVPPQNLVLNGVPTDVIGVVGTASWGPLNAPTIIGDYAGYQKAFGALQARKYDMGTHVATAIQQGAQNFRCVRVSDGTDAAASATVQTNGLTLTARYTGTTGNSLSWVIGGGSKSGTYKVTLALPGIQPEVFDNLASGKTGNAIWVAVADAINNGTGALRGPSQIAVATAGASTTAPVTTGATASGTLSGGVDGATLSDATALIGVDTVPRKGMYALRGQGCSIGVLADVDDSTQWTTEAQFGLAEGIYMILTGPSGDTIANALTTKSTAGLDSYACKLMHGDWIYWHDQVNQTLRLVSPQGFVAGRLANLSPEQSSLNKPLYSVAGSQKSGLPGSGQISTYSSAELASLIGAGIDVIANPQPAGAFWGVRGGHNSSSNAATNGDNYTRLTNFIAATLSAGMGLFVGRVVNADLFRQIRATQLSFLQNLLSQGILGSTDGSLPFSVVCDTSNNPDSRTSLGYVQSDAQIKYQAINEKFIVNMEGGQTVAVSRQTLPGGRVA